MKIREPYLSMNGAEVWDIIKEYVETNGRFDSVTGIEYKADLSDTGIFYKGGTGNRGSEGEEISMDDFIEGFNNIKSLAEINTGSIEDKISNALNRKRSPFIGLLLTSGILERC